ncbi:MAG: glycosyl transferase, partial [Lachnoanaerobaculum gingivalis]
KSNSKKDFVLITNVEQNKFYDQLLKDTGFDKDPRVKFVGTVYDQELLKYIRENAFAYFHGHEVGGTNPSLLEALASTRLNLLLDVGFNREVGENGAIYWRKDELARVIEAVEQFDENAISELDKKSSQRIAEAFTWEEIVVDYEEEFEGGKSE